MAKFGCKPTYVVGDRVWIYGCPRDGVGTVTKIHKSKYDVTCDLGPTFDSCTADIMKPATAMESGKSKNRRAEWDRQHAKGVKQTADLMERLIRCKPHNTNNSMALGDVFGAMIKKILTGDQIKNADLNAARLEDMIAVQAGRSLGYCGAPRSDYSPGERVRVRQGLVPGFWDEILPGMTGTVCQDQGLLSLFPISPMQPKGITIAWDNGTKTTDAGLSTHHNGKRLDFHKRPLHTDM